MFTPILAVTLLQRFFWFCCFIGFIMICCGGGGTSGTITRSAVRNIFK
jgi:hypothetical protein